MKPSTPAPFWRPHFLPLLKPFAREFALGAAAAIGAALLTVMAPWPLKVVIDGVLAHRPIRVPLLRAFLEQAALSPMQILYGACAATLLIAAATSVLTYYYTRTLNHAGQRFVFELRGNLFAHMQRLSLSFHDRRRTGDLTARLTSDITSIQNFVVNGLVQMISNGCLLVGIVATMVWMNWRFAAAALSTTPFLFWMVLKHTREMRTAARQARASEGHLASVAQESLSSIRIIQGLGQEEQQDGRFLAQSETSLQASLESIRHQARIRPIVEMLRAVSIVMVMWFGATQVLAHRVTTGDVVVFFAYVSSLYTPIRTLSRLISNLTRATVGAERIAEVMESRSEVADRPKARPAPPFRGQIEFRNVSFGYEPGKPILQDVNLTIAPGEKVALVGTSGAGKSTLMSLVPRLYDPTRGSVCIDGEDIRTHTAKSVRAQIGLVFQDALLFSGSVADNIRFGRPDATDDETIAAARLAGAHEFIQRLPEGYATPVAERGTTLSGGQKQRIAIARAVLRRTPILLMDEPTSSLDLESELSLLDGLRRAAEGKTVLFIVHRLTLARFADRVIVLDRGRVVEQGAPAELRARDSRYARMCALQREPALTRAGQDGAWPALVPSRGESSRAEYGPIR